MRNIIYFLGVLLAYSCTGKKSICLKYGLNQEEVSTIVHSRVIVPDIYEGIKDFTDQNFIAICKYIKEEDSLFFNNKDIGIIFLKDSRAPVTSCCVFSSNARYCFSSENKNDNFPFYFIGDKHASFNDLIKETVKKSMEELKYYYESFDSAPVGIGVRVKQIRNEYIFEYTYLE